MKKYYLVSEEDDCDVIGLFIVNESKTEAQKRFIKMMEKWRGCKVDKVKTNLDDWNSVRVYFVGASVGINIDLTLLEAY